MLIILTYEAEDLRNRIVRGDSKSQTSFQPRSSEFRPYVYGCKFDYDHIRAKFNTFEYHEAEASKKLSAGSMMQKNKLTNMIINIHILYPSFLHSHVTGEGAGKLQVTPHLSRDTHSVL